MSPEVWRMFWVINAALFIFTPLAWMSFDRDPPYTFEKVIIEPPEPRAGGNVYITFHVRPGNPNCSAGRIYREYKIVKTGRLFVYDPIPRAEPPDTSRGEFTRVSDLPPELSGETIYRATACYPCNPLHRLLNWPVCVRTPEVKFNVNSDAK